MFTRVGIKRMCGRQRECGGVKTEQGKKLQGENVLGLRQHWPQQRLSERRP